MSFRIVLGLILSSAFVFADDETPGKNQISFNVSKDVPIESILGRYHMVVDLGELPAGATGMIKLNLINNHQQHFSIERLELGCRCSSASLQFDELKPNTKASLSVKLTTALHARKALVVNTLTLISADDPSENLNLLLRYRLAGLMCFAADSFMQEADPSLDRQTVRIPLNVTSPVLPSEVKISTLPAEFGVVANVITENSHHFVEVTFDPVFVDEDGVPLSIVIADPSRGLEDQYTLVLTRRKSIEISPKSLIFKRSDEMVTANCIIRYRPPLSQETSRESVADAKLKPILPIFIEAKLGDSPVDTKVRKLGEGIYRVGLQFPYTLLEKRIGLAEMPKLNWHILVNRKRFSAVSSINTHFTTNVRNPSPE